MYYGEQRSPEVANATQRVAILPLGATEQHGDHLPLLTDTLICNEIVGRAERELGDTALFLPTLPVGVSDHHRAFAGTLSLQSATYIRVLDDLLECLIADGFRRIVLFNAHGGNEIPGYNAIYNVQRRHARALPELWIAFASWMDLASAQIAEIPSLTQKQVTHACELETSMILHLRPELVRMDVAHGANIPPMSAFYTPDFRAPSRVYVPRQFEQLSRTGAFGHPEHATAASGAALFDTATAEFVAFVREFATWQPVVPA